MISSQGTHYFMGLGFLMMLRYMCNDKVYYPTQVGFSKR